MKNIVTFISGAGLLLSLGVVNVPAARATYACTNATVKGNFCLTVSGAYLSGVSLPAGSFSEAGLI